MKKMQVELNITSLNKVYWEKMNLLEKRKKAQKEDSQKHNGYIDRTHYHHLARLTGETQREVQAMYAFLQDFVVAPQIEVKRGTYDFEIQGEKYTLKKHEIETNFGWKKAVTTEWRVEGEGEFAGTTGDTKKELIERINYRLRSRHINKIIGENPEKKQSHE